MPVSKVDRIKFYLTALLFVCLQNWSFAQNDQYKFSHLDVSNGLSDNQVNCFFRDDKGFMWFGTTSGLDRYDGYEFKIFKHEPNNDNSLAENHVMNIYEGPDKKLWIFSHSATSIYNATTEKFSNDVSAELKRYHIPVAQVTAVKKDNEGDFWFISSNEGIYRYDPKHGFTVFYSSSQKSKATLYSNFVMDIVSGPGQNTWLIYSDGTIDQLNTATNKIIKRYDGIAKTINNKPESLNMILDNYMNLWVYSPAQPIGAFCINTQNYTSLHLSKDGPAARLNSNIVNSIVQADDNKIWIGTDHGGINIYDRVTGKISYLLSRADDSKSLSGNSVSLYKDPAGIIWAGTFKQGLNYYHSGIMQFPLYRHFTTDPQSLPYEDINGFAEDAAGNLWMGTNGGGLVYFNRSNNTYTQYKHDPLNPNSLSNDVIICLHIDKEGKLWIGTYFGGLECYDGKTFKHHRHDENKPGSISDDRIYSIMEDSEGNLWAGTFAGGLNVLDRKSDTFRHPVYKGGMCSDYTSVLYEDKQQDIWIGRDKGIDEIIKKTGTVKHYFFPRPNQSNLTSVDVNAITEDRRGLMWIGTKDGLTVFDTKKGKVLSAADGIIFPSSNVSNIVEDNDGKMWISTTNGLTSIKLTKAGARYNFETNNFNEFDGLQGRWFNLYAALKLRNGELVFGGAHGFNLFNPERINNFKLKQNLVFTDLQLFNKSVGVGDAIKGNVILTKSISETGLLTLNHSENVFSIGFAECAFFNPDKINYEYQLEGFDKGWIVSPTSERRAVYTNLDGGDYNFKVRAQNANNAADVSTITMKIRILPPFWKTPLAYISYIIVALGMLFYIRQRGIIKLKKQFEATQAEIEAERKLENEREEARRMHQLDLMKIKFFTNISHEFRTPLSLILTPIDDLIKKSSDDSGQQQQLAMIKRNGKRLLNLVNQLLDFRKMEYNELKLCLWQGDIVSFIKDVSSSFADVAHQKQIDYVFESEVCSCVTRFDHDKMERILFNLLSNAFKFTPSGGHISVMLSLRDTQPFTNEAKVLQIKVIDTGIGIPAKNQEKIFERFFQDNLPESLLNQGSGIGLSITKEFIRMHGGSINIESEPDYGTCFIIDLPVVEQAAETLLKLTVEDEPVRPAVKHADETLSASKKPTILLIEDNDDLRFYLKDNLKLYFHISEAVNGKDGWQKALAVHPNLIVSDVSMPEMNGIDLAKKIKADSRTAQIPIILLTALSTDHDQLAGLGSGANDYIIKPFNFEILLSKIHSLLKMQETMKQTYQKQVEIQAKDIVVVSEDDKFLKNAMDCIEKNITNPNFSVEELSSRLNVSRVSLYKKLLTLTGKTPVDCIRTIRLKRATQLLEKSKLSIANVAYEVGFNNAAYFAKVFKEEFGMLPSEYIAEIRNKEKEETTV